MNKRKNKAKSGKHDPRVSGRASRIYRTLVADPRAGLSAIRAALTKAKGRVDKAAEELEVSSRTLSRWLELSNLRHFASNLRAEHNIPGPRQ